MERIGVGVDHQKQNISTLDQGDINCGTSSQTDFILNYFLSNFPSNFLSNSPFPPSPAGRLEKLMSPCSWLTCLISTIWVIWQDFTVPHNSARAFDMYKGNNWSWNWVSPPPTTLRTPQKWKQLGLDRTSPQKQSHLHGHDQRAQHTQCQDGSRAPLAP